MADSSKYQRWICEQACCVSHLQGDGIQAHHIKGFDQHMGKKVSDLLTIPLHYTLHNELHAKGWRAFEARYSINQQSEALRMISKAYREGVLIAT